MSCGLSMPDEGRLSQVIHNLVINADQSMPGGGRIEVQCANTVLSADEVPLLAGSRHHLHGLPPGFERCSIDKPG